MSYLSPQAEEIVADNNRQPTDMTHDAWASSAGSNRMAQYGQGTPWLRRDPPRLRPDARS
ncbi:hypothetical protein [Aureimonas sp. SK2]|uniref:hypothetical protein n=1 Tax=Aureimonas sp. SK2 TaxID=3015992 RepID=UPI002443E335|nr:hypothetical protein [Aureimonas sp. SK2]